MKTKQVLKSYVQRVLSLTLCLALALTAATGTTVRSYAAEAETFSDTRGIKYSVITQTNESGTVSIEQSPSFVGGELPDTVLHDGTTYTITKISFSAFGDYSGSITKLPAAVTEIGNEAFSGCTGLTVTDLPEGVTSIGRRAFSGCTNLALTSIPDSVTSIGQYAFYNCTNMKLTSLPARLDSLGDAAFLNCTRLAVTCFPEGVTSIGPSTFSGCTNLALTSIPDSVTSIGQYAFYNCTNMKLTSLPARLDSLGDAAFLNCTRLAVTRFPEGLAAVPDETFRGCSNLTQLTLPEGVTSIGFNAFYGCIRLTSLSLPESLTEIDDQAFHGCQNLELTSLPAAVTSVGYQAFWDCDSITYLALGDNITTLGGQLFDVNPTTKKYPDLVIADENSDTYQKFTENGHPSVGTIHLPWDGTQNSLDQSDTMFFVTDTQSLPSDMTLSGEKNLYIVSGGCMTIHGSFTIEQGATVTIAYGGTLIVEGTIVNRGTIVNKGTIINQGVIDNQNEIFSSKGTLEGNEIQGNPAYLTDVMVTPYIGQYDTKPHAGITEIKGTEEGDILSYSNTYAENHSKHPELVTWSDTCPEYTTVKDTANLVTLKVEREVNGDIVTIAIVDAKVTIEKAEIEIKELPEASAITRGDTVGKSILTGGSVVIKGTDIPVDTGIFDWSATIRNAKPALSDSDVTEYDLYYHVGANAGYSYDNAYGSITITVNDCTHEDTDHEFKNASASTCAQKGHTAEEYCLQCGDLLFAGTELPLADHSWDDGTITIPATTAQTGQMTYTCTVCRETRTEVIPKLSNPPSGSESPAAPTNSLTPSGSTAPDHTGAPSVSPASSAPADSPAPSADIPSPSAPSGSSTPAETPSAPAGSSTPPEIPSAPAGSSAPAETPSAPIGSSAPGQTGNTSTSNTNEASDEDPYQDAMDADKIRSINDIAKGLYIKDTKTNGYYRVTSVSKSGGTVAYVKPIKSLAKITVPAKITCSSIKLTVTSIASKALRNNKKVTTLTIGKSIAKIGANAFSGCSCINKITIKTKKLTGRTIGKKAFSKISSKKKMPRVILPKKKTASYAKLLRKRGLKKFKL